MTEKEPPSSPTLAHYYSHSSDSFPLISARDPTQNHDVDIDDDFEFSFFTNLPNFSPVSAEDIFLNGQIKPTSPLLHQNAVVHAPLPLPVPAEPPRRLPLRKLMLEERPTTVTLVNELDGIDAGSYCVWTPQHKKKTSVSKRWKFRKWSSFADSGGAAAKFVGFFSNGNGLGRSNLRPRTK